MVLRVKTLFGQAGLIPSTHNSSSATGFFTWGSDGVFAIKTAARWRQKPFTIAKNNPIFFVTKRPTLADEQIGFLALFGQVL
jgi:hypothetical protein